jgi:hypothetical protein
MQVLRGVANITAKKWPGKNRNERGSFTLNLPYFRKTF